MGVWLANSEKSFATRLVMVLVAPVFLVLGKASEIYWGWVLVSLTVAMGYWLVHRKCLKSKIDLKETQPAPVRFSIRSLLYSMTFVSWFLFVYLHSGYVDLLAWRSVIAIAIAFSLFAICIHAVVLGENGIDDGGDYQPRPGSYLGRDLSLAGRLIDLESIEPR